MRIHKKRKARWFIPGVPHLFCVSAVKENLAIEGGE
jgi:hypothetical protein